MHFGMHELECRRLKAGGLSGVVEYLCLATAAGAECRVVLGSKSHHALERPQGKHFTEQEHNLGQSSNQVKQKKHTLESDHCGEVLDRLGFLLRHGGRRSRGTRVTVTGDSWPPERRSFSRHRGFLLGRETTRSTTPGKTPHLSPSSDP